MTPYLQSKISQRVHPDLRHLVSEDATLAELGWGRDVTWSLLDEIEQEQRRELDWSAGERATTVAGLVAVCGEKQGQPA